MTETTALRAPALLAAGTLAAEAELLEAVFQLLAAAREEPGLLAQPVRVVVPSASLREHLAARLVAQHGALAGVRLQTLNGLAREVLTHDRGAASRGDRLFPVLVRRAAREQAALRDVLEGLEDGYGAAAAAVADLLDAGFLPEVPAHRDALTEAISAAELAPETRERVVAIVRTAEATAAALAGHGMERAGGRLRRAAECLEAEPSRLVARAVFIYGFADATGAVSDLLEALTRACGARVVVDLAPDPAQVGRADFGVAFTERLLARLGVDAAAATAPAPGAVALRAVCGVGTEAEVRGVAERVHALLESGVAAERIGIVARDAASYAVAVRTQFGRLGIAFAAPGTSGPPGGRGRRLHALLALLSDAAATPADRWLDVLAWLDRGARADLRLGLHAMGAPRLRDVAQLDVDARLDEHGGFPLPARLGLAAASEGNAVRARRRRLSSKLLHDAVASARAARERLASWPQHATLREHAARVRTLAGDDLVWPADERLAGLEQVLAGLEMGLGDVDLAFEEFVLVARGAFRELGEEEFGSAGAGVRFLGVVQARSLTFEHLFLLGVNRDVFPRPLLEDPLFPDIVRRPLESLLPEIPLKSRTFEEEHYLFAQLLSASSNVTLSWQLADDDGRARPVSAFVERLRGAGVLSAPEHIPGAHAPPREGRVALRTAQEAALLEGLHGAPERFGELLELAAGEAAALDPGEAVVPASRLAHGRQAVLRELGDRPGSDELGPYFGFVGPVRHAADVRRADLYVTQVERLVRCPWQLFLTRLLRIEPPPNALDALPEVTSLLAGNLVHEVLERIVRESLSQAEAPTPALQVAWPEPPAFEALLTRCATDLMRNEGIGLPGFERLLVEIVRPLLATARELDWPAPGSEVRCRAVEAGGVTEVGLPPRAIHYRADRVDEVAGKLRLIDYKTGKAASQKKLCDDVARGRRLQAAAYAFGSGGEGRYLYLAAGVAPAAVVEARADDAELHEAFEETVTTALLAFDAGAFFPRLTEANGTQPASQCEYCEVRQACAQGDAGARARIARWAQRERGESPAEVQALALWRRGEGGAA
ncbi:MAG: PD-(D/E)XK nuclease family protein [Deltaproteobacteria bacterium]|nr:PD-(D/E)XK nuclease family protein [Deltaproteobacteria bacterium]MBW2362578.1 PD-(D/E)XK nuclease family protein [Deltaproteobacteria bacterium]